VHVPVGLRTKGGDEGDAVVSAIKGLADRYLPINLFFPSLHR